MNWDKLKNRKLTPVQNYTAGFIFSLILTIIPYNIVVEDKLSGGVLLFSLMGYAVIQFIVQVVFFLHLSDENKPRWNFISLVFMISVVLFIAIGTLWIMKNLNYNMTNQNPTNIEKTLLEDQNFQTELHELEHTSDN